VKNAAIYWLYGRLFTQNAKKVFGDGALLGPTEGACSASPETLAVFKGPLPRERSVRKEQKKEERRDHPLYQFLDPPLRNPAANIVSKATLRFAGQAPFER